MEKYIDIIGDDPLLYFEVKHPDDYLLKLKKDLALKEKEIFTYTSQFKIKPINEAIISHSEPTERDIDKCAIHFKTFSNKRDSIILTIHNLTNTQYMLKKDTLLGHMCLTRSLLNRLDTPHYADNNIRIYETIPGSIKTITYTFDKNNPYKIELTLDKQLYKNPPTFIPQLGEK